MRLFDLIPVMLAEVGYALEGCGKKPFKQIVEMQVALSEVGCETQQAEREGVPLHVPVFENILAEKLKALAQQATRDIIRSNDIFDLWYFTTEAKHPVDKDKVAAYLKRKAVRWDDVQPCRAAFFDGNVEAHSAEAYGAIAAKLPPGVALSPFEEAYDQLRAFVNSLGLPA